MNEAQLIRKIYRFIKNQSSEKKPIKEKELMKKFKLTKEEFNHYLHLMTYKYNLPLKIKFDTIKDKKNNRTICHFCKKAHGIFRIMEKTASIKGTEIKGLFVCDNCYNKILDNEIVVNDKK